MSIRSIVLRLHRLADSSWLNFVSGLILLLCAGLECGAVVTEELLGIPIGAHHGIAFFGAIQMLKTLPDFMKGIKFVDEGDRDLVARLQTVEEGHVSSADCAGTA